MSWRQVRKRFRDPQTQVRLALSFAATCTVGWPISIVVTNEPPLILSLSWLALIIPALGLAVTANLGDDDD